ncbi:MAG: HAD-IB family phosphatase [Bryobacterales bacterium]|nr:HAD-IB family phosphatase [Bryobacterales bacterium]
MTRRPVLISDFDGTITENDFFALVMDLYMGPEDPDYWSQYGAGRITHFEAMKGIFSHAPTDPARLDDLIARCRPDPGLGEAARCLERGGWDLIVVSAGAAWYIERILAAAGVAAGVYANPGRIVPGHGLVLDPPSRSPFFSPEIGIDKAGVVRDALARYSKVAFAGDGPPDLEASLLVEPALRFARGFLARELTRRAEPFHPFERWSDVVRALDPACS